MEYMRVSHIILDRWHKLWDTKESFIRFSHKFFLTERYFKKLKNKIKNVICGALYLYMMAIKALRVKFQNENVGIIINF